MNIPESDIEQYLLGFRMTTAEITYRMPDKLNVLQIFVWQQMDLPPEHPRLRDFLEFWKLNIEGPLYAVRVSVHPHHPTEAAIIGEEFDWR